MDLTEHTGLTNAPCDQLRDLRAKIKYQNPRMHAGMAPAVEHQPKKARSVNVVVRRLFGDLYIMDMGFANPSTGDLYKLSPFVEFLNRSTATISHT